MRNILICALVLTVLGGCSEMNANFERIKQCERTIKNKYKYQGIDIREINLVNESPEKLTGHAVYYSRKVKKTAPCRATLDMKTSQYVAECEIDEPVPYIDNGDCTVTDKSTGLKWQKCSAGQECVKQLDKLTCTGKGKEYSLFKANYYCNTLELGGKKWRVPVLEELETLLIDGPFPRTRWSYESRNPPVIDFAFFPNTEQKEFWSNTSYEKRVSFGYGDRQESKYDKKYVTYALVRCVFRSE
jgi:hypothetical protein